LTPSRSYSKPKSTIKTYRSSSSHYTPSYSDRKAVGVQRDSKGKIKRSQSEKQKFLKQYGYKKVPSGYEVDHIAPLSEGGADKASNMQLIPKSQHKAKHGKR
jgi:5-methylcytosine-specific restriction endonuclease McrA